MNLFQHHKDTSAPHREVFIRLFISQFAVTGSPQQMTTTVIYGLCGGTTTDADSGDPSVDRVLRSLPSSWNDASRSTSLHSMGDSDFTLFGAQEFTVCYLKNLLFALTLSGS